MQFKNAWLKIAACAALVAATAATHAQTYNFALTGSYTANWSLDASPVPGDGADGVGFIMWDVSGNFPGAVSTVVDLTFWHADEDGGLSIEDFYEEITLAVTSGEQLYTGTEGAPAFKLGTFAMTEYQGTGTYSLTISAVPEPAALALMLAGLGVVGVAARRRAVQG